jgi:hypothetical protein
VNGDGYADVVVGADHPGGNFKGRALAYHGSATGLSATPNWMAGPEQAFAFFGFSEAGEGELPPEIGLKGLSDLIRLQTKRGGEERNIKGGTPGRPSS